MLYRIWSRTRNHYAAEWCDAKAGFWDDTVRGSSPLQAVLRRLMSGELTQHTDNQVACALLFDVASFSESISFSLGNLQTANFVIASRCRLLSVFLLKVFERAFGADRGCQAVEKAAAHLFP